MLVTEPVIVVLEAVQALLASPEKDNPMLPSASVRVPEVSAETTNAKTIHSADQIAAIGKKYFFIEKCLCVCIAFKILYNKEIENIQ